MENDLLYRLALTRVQGIGAFHTKALLSRFGEAEAIFRTNTATLEKIRGIGKIRAKAIVEFSDFHAAEEELAFLKKYKIRPLFFTDKDYPQRLLKYNNAPALLFYKGNADLNASKIVAVVGTRAPTEYGRQATDKFIKELAVPGLLVVSGLAYGIDAAAHRAALNHHLPTIGVLGHGLDQIYPQQHAGLAKEMIRQGGLLTEFSSNTKPDEHNFPTRNRIVAGISDALIVVETGCQGGSLLTVENAIAYEKKVFAFPGRITDSKSAGCNSLIQKGRARLLTSSQQLMQEMEWDQPVGKPGPEQGLLFPAAGSALSDEEKTILHLLRETESLSLDELMVKDNLNSARVTMALLNLELQGLVNSLPGKIYCLNGNSPPPSPLNPTSHFPSPAQPRNKNLE